MAVVPTDEIPTVQQDPLPGRAIPRFSDSASPADFGAGLGAGLEQLGADYGDVQKAQERKAQADADRVVLAQANTKLSNWQNQASFQGTEANKGADAAFRQTGLNAVDMPGKYLPQFDAQAAQISATMTPHQQSMFAERVATERDSFGLQLNRYEFEQGNREAVETFQNAKSTAIQSAALNYRDPESAARARDDIYNAGMSLATRVGQEKAYKEEGYAKDLDGLHESTVGAFLADGNTAGAQKYLDKWKGDLSSGTVHDTLENRILAEEDRRQAQHKEVARDALEDARKGALAGIPGSAALVSDAQLKLLRPDDWQRQRTFLNNAADTGAAEKRYDTMTPAAIESDLLAQRPTTAKPGIGDDIELYNMRQQAAQRSIQRRAADPAQFAISSGQGWQPLDFSDQKGRLAQLRTRANTAPEMSQEMGVRVPLLSKPEAASMAQQLDSQPAAQRMQTLAALHQGLPDERAYFSILNQIAPHSPVTAIVGQKVDAPQGANAPIWYDGKFAPNPQDGERILRGETLLNPPKGANGEEKGGFKEGFPMPTDQGGAGLKAYFGDHTKDLFAKRGELAGAHYSAFRSAYAALSDEASDLTGQPNTTRMKQAFTMALGPTANFNGRQVAVPTGMDSTRFQSYVTKAVDAEAKQRGSPEDYADRMRGFTLRETDGLGSGHYIVLNGGFPVTSKGREFTIDLHQQYLASSGAVHTPGRDVPEQGEQRTLREHPELAPP